VPRTRRLWRVRHQGHRGLPVGHRVGDLHGPVHPERVALGDRCPRDQAELDCVAGVYLKYLKQEDLRAYVDGKATLDDMGIEPNAAASKDMLACFADESAANGG
jgi:hypothetical protein